RFERESAGVRAIDPVTSPFAAGAIPKGVKFGRIVGRFDVKEGWSAGFKIEGAWGAAAGGGAAGVELGRAGGARSEAVRSISAGAARGAGWVSTGAVDVSDSVTPAAISLFVASVSKPAASLASRVSKSRKSNVLLANWIDPMMIATMLAARNPALTRVMVLVRADSVPPPFALRSSGRACRPFGSWPAA